MVRVDLNRLEKKSRLVLELIFFSLVGNPSGLITYPENGRCVLQVLNRDFVCPYRAQIYSAVLPFSNSTVLTNSCLLIVLSKQMESRLLY